jgi:hypothetical protein
MYDVDNGVRGDMPHHAEFIMASRQRRHPLFRSDRPSSPPWSRRRWHCPVIFGHQAVEPRESAPPPGQADSQPVTVTLPPVILRKGARSSGAMR